MDEQSEGPKTGEKSKVVGSLLLVGPPVVLSLALTTAVGTQAYYQQQTVSALQEEKDSLDDMIEDFREQTKELEQKLVVLVDRNEGLSTALKTTQEELTTSMGEREAARQEVSALKEKKKELEEKIGELEDAGSAKDSELAAARSELVAARSELVATAEALETALAREGETEAKLAAAMTKLKTSEGKVGELQDQLVKVTGRLRRTRREAAYAKLELKARSIVCAGALGQRCSERVNDVFVTAGPAAMASWEAGAPMVLRGAEAQGLPNTVSLPRGFVLVLGDESVADLPAGALLARDER